MVVGPPATDRRSDAPGFVDAALEKAVERAVPPGERERTTLCMRFFRDMTQARIAGLLDVWQIHVSRSDHPLLRVRDEVLNDAA
ncbi:sigma factor-like helix-turn-helix DNA-binding protein [Streptomyces sp. NPDC059262]|uniref:sigma factor-like helix-turn-helix DNA-binding protein n=1 Tax=Streptomyces sp. NPDC059262 TaxID=3346797 RepID=UPI00368D20E3